MTACKRINSKQLNNDANGSCYKNHLCPNKVEGNFLLLPLLFAFPKKDFTFSSSLAKTKGRSSHILTYINYYFLLDLLLINFHWAF